MGTPAVSVVMSAYNAAPFLREAVESILDQTFGDFEFIIVDDGSTDETPEILAGYRDPRLRVMRQENSGLMVSLNRAIAASRAPLIARMDADDVSLPERLAREISVLRARRDIEFVTTRMACIDREGRATGAHAPSTLPRSLVLRPLQGFDRTFLMDGPILEMLLERNFLPHASLMARKGLFVRAGGYDERFKRSEDFDLWLRMFRRNRRIAYIAEDLYLYRKHPVNTDRSLLTASHAYDIEAIRKFVNDPDVSEPLRRYARRVLGRRQKDQAYRLQCAGDRAAARRMYVEALRNCPNMEHLIAWLLNACMLPNVPVMRMVRLLAQSAGHGAGREGTNG